MEVNAISFTAKTPKLRPNKKAYQKALEEAFGQSDKDYIILSKKAKSQTPVVTEKFVQEAKKFFSGILGQ